MVLSFEKIIQNKIYVSSPAQVKTDKSGKFFLVVSDPSIPSRFLKVTEWTKFLPQGKTYIYYPEKLLNPATLGEVSSSKERGEFFASLGGEGGSGSFERIPTLTAIPKEKMSNNRPIVVPIGEFFLKVSPYISSNKKTAQARYAYLKVVYRKIFEEFSASVPKESPPNLIVDFDSKSPNVGDFLFFLGYGIRKDFEGMVEALGKLTVTLVDPENGVILQPNLRDRKKAVQTFNLTSKFVQISRNFDPATAEKTASDATSEGQFASGDLDAAIEGPSPEGKAAGTEASDGLSQGSPAVDPLDESSVTKADEVDLSELLATDASAEFEKQEKENREFVLKFLEVQTKAFGNSEKTPDDFVLDVPIADDPRVMGTGVKTSKATSITSSYYKKLFRKDLAALLTSINDDPEYPVVATSFSMKDSSDPLNLKDEVSVVFLDKTGKRHNFVVDVPKLSSDGFLYINGNKKFIAKQSLLLPIVKEAPDRVQITTSYAKTFLFRKGNKTNSVTDRIFKTLVGKMHQGVSPMYGNSFASNIPFGVSVTYNYLATRLFILSFATGEKSSLDFYFSQKKIRSQLAEAGREVPEGKNPVAIVANSGKVLDFYVEDIETRKIEKVGSSGKILPGSHPNLQDFIVETMRNFRNPDVFKAFESATAGKAYGYTDIKLAGSSVPLGILVSFYRGMLTAFDEYGIKYELSVEKRRAKTNETLIQFRDMNVYADLEGDTAKELFANGIYFLNTRDFSYKDAERRGALYIEYFGESIGSRNIAKAYINFESSMIDPITREVLEDLKLPTKFVPLLFKANDMLSGFTHKRKNDMTNFRVRDSEVLAVAVYDTLMKSFNEYKRTVKTGVVTPISAPRDAVIKKVQTMPNVEDYSVLSPFLEMELKSKTTFKGPSGLNSSDAYTAEIRSYDPSMIGLFGIFSPVSGEIGVNRSMVLNPKIRNNRGYLDHPKVDDLEADSLFASGELLNLFSANYSDPMRTGMATTQGKHIVATKVQHNYLVGSGLDKTLSRLIGNDFAWKAADGGVVTKIDDKNRLVFVKYDSGQTTAIDVSDKPAKNSASGFFIRNRLELLDGIKVGTKFKKGDILATNRSFFRKDMEGSHGFAPGRLTKVAMMCLPTTYEDSAPVIERVAKEMASDIITEKQVGLKENSKIISIAKEGQKINVNEPLIIFEEIGDSEKSALAAIEKASLASEGDEELSHLGRNVIKSKYSGVITNIKVYYNCDLESEAVEPTLKSYVKGYISKVKTRGDALKGIKDDDLIELPSVERIDSDKILGNEMSGVLIVFYIMHEEKLDVGNKLSFFSACKGIVSEVIPDELAPTTEYRSDEVIEAVVSPMSLISRNTPDLPLQGFSNKVVLELKKQCIEELFGK